MIDQNGNNKFIMNEYAGAMETLLGKKTGYTFSKKYENNILRPLISTYGITEVDQAFKIAINMYFKDDIEGSTIPKILDMVGGILYNRKNNLEAVKWDGK